MKRFNPTILHTRNLPTMEYAIAGALAGVPCRVHGEHGRDVHDQYGASQKFRLFRKFIALWIHHFITVSGDLAHWFQSSIGINRRQISQIYNGVDVQRFHPGGNDRREILPKEFTPSDLFIVGTIGRMQIVKDQTTLVRAYLHLRKFFPDIADRVRLVLVGDGSLRVEIQQIIEDEKISQYVWMPGERGDIPDLMRSFDLFVLPSEAEGISNTILEAMASGLPIVATDVGGNSELVKQGSTGSLVPPKNPLAMADAIVTYVKDGQLVQQHGQAGRALVENRFSLEAMVNEYLAVYDALLDRIPDDKQRQSSSIMSSVNTGM